MELYDSRVEIFSLSFKDEKIECYVDINFVGLDKEGAKEKIKYYFFANKELQNLLTSFEFAFENSKDAKEECQKYGKIMSLWTREYICKITKDEYLYMLSCQFPMQFEIFREFLNTERIKTFCINKTTSCNKEVFNIQDIESIMENAFDDWEIFPLRKQTFEAFFGKLKDLEEYKQPIQEFQAKLKSNICLNTEDFNIHKMPSAVLFKAAEKLNKTVSHLDSHYCNYQIYQLATETE